MGGHYSCVSFKFMKNPLQKINSDPLKAETSVVTTPIIVDINNCSEEELMKLPGVDHRLAEYIIRHRPYGEPQELALLPKIGWKRLLPILKECSITASSSERTSASLSFQSTSIGNGVRYGTAPQPDGSASLEQSTLRTSCEMSTPRLCINECSPKDLLDQFPWLHPSIAYRIVRHRHRHGPFTMIEQLVSVKGVDSAMLQVIRPYLSLHPLPASQVEHRPPHPQLRTSNSVQYMRHACDDYTSLSSFNMHSSTTREDNLSDNFDFLTSLSLLSSKLQSTHQKQQQSNQLDSPNRCASSARPSSQLPSNLHQMNQLAECFTSSQLDILACMEPLRKKVVRPVRPEFTYLLAGREAVRLAWWHDLGLGGLSLERVSDNPGVREVIALSILELGWSFICFSNARVEAGALRKLCEDMNQPTLPNIKRWYGYRGNWSYSLVSNEEEPNVLLLRNMGCLYDTNKITSLRFVVMDDLGLVCCIIEMPSSTITKLMYVSSLTEDDQVSHKFSWNEFKINCAVDQIPDMEFLVLTNKVASSCQGQELVEQGFECISIPKETSNDKNIESSESTHQFWLSPSMLRQFTKNSSEVRLGLSHPLLPTVTGGWNGALCQSGPAWMEFFISSL